MSFVVHEQLIVSQTHALYGECSSFSHADGCSLIDTDGERQRCFSVFREDNPALATVKVGFFYQPLVPDFSSVEGASPDSKALKWLVVTLSSVLMASKFSSRFCA